MSCTARTAAAYSIKGGNLAISGDAFHTSKYDRYISINRRFLNRTAGLEVNLKTGVVSFKRPEQSRPVTEIESKILKKALLNSVEILDSGYLVE